MSETRRPGVRQGAGERSGSKAATAPPEALERLIRGYVKTAALQSEYQALHQSLPNVLSLAGEILKKKEESEKAYAQGLEVVEKVLTDASQKAEALSQAMATQHDALAAILGDKELLGEILKSGKAATAAAFEAVAPGAQGGAGPGSSTANPQVASQLNAAMDRIRSMISQEVQRQAELLRGGAPGPGARPN
ncbi:hypothetical protein [Roseibium sp.]|uniref:hypothetical protein n=1 Tax=Roseibium sp. TaxID=1936156 RepID=UPI003A975C7D